uniref:VQ domain-containing protein n=1 Tax=Globodera rostochiensis TaxID=31243 RepID=A0A914H8G9_GLORO
MLFINVLIVIVSLCKGCFGMDKNNSSTDPSELRSVHNVGVTNFKAFVQRATGQPKATTELPGTSDSFQQPQSDRSWIKDLMSTGAHLKKNSGPSTAPIMPQSPAMLYNSTGRTSMPMSHHPTTASSYQPSGTNIFMADTNNSRTFGQQNSTGSQPFPTAHGQSSALALPGGGGGTSTALQPNQSTIRKGKSKATSSASFKQPKSGRSSGTNFFADKPKATSSDAFQSQQVGGSAPHKQQRETIALIKSFMTQKQNSGPSTAPIMPQNSAMLYNSVPMSHHQPSGTNFFMADTNNSRTFGQQNSTGSQPFPTAHGQSSALALPGGGGTSTALQSDQSSPLKGDALVGSYVQGWWT